MFARSEPPKLYSGPLSALSSRSAATESHLSLALNHLKNTAWAMTEDALRTMVSIVQQHGEIESLERVRGSRPRNIEKASVRGGVALIPVRGPLFKRANLMTEVCGASSYELLMRDFHQLLESPEVKSIVFDIDSPGGEANGTSELADAIFAARSKKPTAAYIGGTGASAAYWIASACDQIFASDSAIVGSIGVQSVMHSEKDEGEIRFVSSQSPNKNRDPATDDGAREVQSVIDGLAEVFIGKVARNRGVARADVLEKFGQGSVFVGAEAQKRGLIDHISTLENVIATLGEQNLIQETITAEFIAEKHPALASHFMALGAERALAKVSAEEKRKETIRSLGQGQVSAEFCQGLIDRQLDAQDAAVEILLEMKRNPPVPKVDPRKEFDSRLAALDVPPRTDTPDKTLDEQQDAALALAQKIDGLKVRGR